MKTPCIRVCKLEDGVCIGCGRTQEQLRMWTTYTDEERDEIMKRKSNPMAKDLRQPKYKPRVIPKKNKQIPRERKHKHGTTSNSVG